MMSQRRKIALAVAALVLAAVIGGVVGGLIVHWTWDSSSGTAESASACPAASVADQALPSVVTVRAGTSSGSGVVIRPGGYILTNNHVISVAADGGPISIQRSNGEDGDATPVGRGAPTHLPGIK